MDERVFISYSTQDRDIAFRIVKYLEDKNFRCWIAPRDIGTGMDYSDVINDAIEHCRALVLVLSKNAAQSQFVKKELSTAVSFNRTVIPFKVSQVELTGGFLFLLNNVQWIDATHRTNEIMAEIVGALNGTPSAPHPPKRRGRWKWVVAATAALVLALVAVVAFSPASNNAPKVTDSMVVAPTDGGLVEQSTVVEETEEPVDKTEKRGQRQTTDQQTKNAENKKKVISTKLAADVNVPADIPTVETEPEKTETGQSSESKQPAGTSNKLGKARRYFNNGKYQAALNLFEELKRENPSDATLDYYISECKSHLK